MSKLNALCAESISYQILVFGLDGFIAYQCTTYWILSREMQEPITPSFHSVEHGDRQKTSAEGLRPVDYQKQQFFS
jgi:hypothetical protein